MEVRSSQAEGRGGETGHLRKEDRLKSGRADCLTNVLCRPRHLELHHTYQAPGQVRGAHYFRVRDREKHHVDILYNDLMSVTNC